MQSTAAKRYAAALHALARDKNLSQQFSAQLEELARIWDTQPEFRQVLLSPKLGVSQKRSILLDVGKRLDFDRSMANLMDFMLDKGRINILPDLASEFRYLEDQVSGRVRALCKAARPLTEVQLAQLRDRILTMTGAKEVLITVEIDPSLLAGFIVSIDGKMIDGSLKGRLLRVQSSMATENQQ